MKKNTFFFAHASAFIDKNSKIGEETKIWHNSHVTDTAIIGKDCSIGQNCYVAGVLGNFCRLQNNVNLYKGVELGNYVFCGPSMTFTNDLNPRAEYPKNGHLLTTKVGTGVSFGAGSVIVCGINIGDYAFIGAGAVVTKDIPAYALVYGNPAEFKGWICKCGKKMPLEFKEYSCRNCTTRYKKKKQIIEQVKI